MLISELYNLYCQHPIITTDSRDCPAGSIFLALKGASFNGNKFAASALQKGCAYAIVDDPDYMVAGDSRYLFTDDCLSTFKQLAREHRRRFNIPVVGITGTNGKTTTKELIAAVLQEKYNVMATKGNFNNDVGVPKTLFQLNANHELAVVEMGASHPGDIRTLVETAEPTCGLITNVGRAHLQGFGSFEGVMATKGELYDFLKEHNAPAFIHKENAYLQQMAAERSYSNLIFYSTNDDIDCAVCGKVERDFPSLTFLWREREHPDQWNRVETHLVGAYNLSNLMAAVCVGRHFGVPSEQINQALANYQPTNNRSQWMRTKHNTLIVDAYNANPTSMMTALENFLHMAIPADMEHKMLILGDMKELGSYSEEEHQKIVDYLKANFETVWLVGEAFIKTGAPFRMFHDVEEVKTALSSNPPRNCFMLIKGSNSTRLYTLPELL